MLIGLVVLFLQVPPPLPAPVPPPVIRNEITVLAPSPDPEVIAETAVQSTQAILMTMIAPPLVDWDNELLGLPDFWRTTPPNITYEHSEIRGLSDMMRLATAGLLAIMLFVLGMTRALGEAVSWGRFLFAATLSTFELLLWQLGIDLNNAICAFIGAPDLPGLIRPHLNMTIDHPGEQIGIIILLIVYAIVALMLLFSLLFRIGLIQVLLAIGPIALACYATPQTQGLAQLYTRIAVGLLFSQVMIVIGLRLAGVLSGLGTGIAGTLLAIVMLLILRRLPGLLSSASNQGGHSMLGQLAVMSLFRRFRTR